MESSRDRYSGYCSIQVSSVRMEHDAKRAMLVIFRDKEYRIVPGTVQYFLTAREESNTQSYGEDFVSLEQDPITCSCVRSQDMPNPRATLR